MPTISLPMFTAPSYGDRTINEVQRCVNLYPEKTPSGWKLVSRRGFTNQDSVLNGASCRLPFVSRDGTERVYSVHGNTVYRLNSDGTTAATIGTLATSSGVVWMAENPTQIFITDGTDGYIITKSSDAFATISDVNFPGNPIGAAYLDGYFITAARLTGTFYLSALNSGTNWTPSTFATAESTSDRLVDIRVARQQLILMGTGSQETWYNTGNSTFPFERITGASNKIGVYNTETIAQHEDEIFFIANGGEVWHYGSGGHRKISTPYIESKLDLWSYNAGFTFSFAYKQDGHFFYQVSNTSTNETWVYDLTTDAWHERKNGTSSYDRLRFVLDPFQNNVDQSGWAFDATNGGNHRFLEYTHTDLGTNITRIRTFGPIEANAKRIFHNSIRFVLEIEHDSLASYTLSATLEWSDDAGKTWSTARTMSKAITTGETPQRVMLQLNRMGSSRQRYYRLTFTGPAARLVLQSAELEYDVGGH